MPNGSSICAVCSGGVDAACGDFYYSDVLGAGDCRAVIDGKRQRQESDVCLRDVDNLGRDTDAYPQYPSGSPKGMTGFSATGARFSIMMPQPERVFRAVQYPSPPAQWREDGPWLRLFQNARKSAG